MDKELVQYIVNYINYELDRGNVIDTNTIYDAIEAYEGGAR